MDYSKIIKGLEWVIENRHEIAADAEATIHLLRRVEHLCVKHSTTADRILLAADDGLKKVADATQPNLKTSTNAVTKIDGNRIKR